MPQTPRSKGDARPKPSSEQPSSQDNRLPLSPETPRSPHAKAAVEAAMRSFSVELESALPKPLRESRDSKATSSAGKATLRRRTVNIPVPANCEQLPAHIANVLIRRQTMAQIRHTQSTAWDVDSLYRTFSADIAAAMSTASKRVRARRGWEDGAHILLGIMEHQMEQTTTQIDRGPARTALRGAMKRAIADAGKLVLPDGTWASKIPSSTTGTNQPDTED